MRVAVENFLMEFGVDFDGIGLYELCCSRVVALRCDALNLGEELAEEIAEGLIVVDADEGLALLVLDEFDDVVGAAFLIAPFGDELAVAHVGFLDVLAGLDAHELGHHAVENVLVVFGLVCVRIVEETDFDEFRVGEVIEREEVGACFLDGRAVSLEGVTLCSGEELARTVAETLVEVGMEVIGDEEIFVKEVARGLVDDELFIEAVAVRCCVVSLSDVFKRHALRAVGSANPVGIGKVYADRGGGIGVTGKDGCGDDLGRNTLYGVLLEFGVCG